MEGKEGGWRKGKGEREDKRVEKWKEGRKDGIGGEVEGRKEEGKVEIE